MAALIVATVLLAAAHASTQEPVRVGGAIQAPRKIRDVQPFYPEGARSKGVVVLQCIIGSDGRVTRADVVQSIPELDRAAVELYEHATTPAPDPLCSPSRVYVDAVRRERRLRLFPCLFHAYAALMRVKISS